MAILNFWKTNRDAVLGLSISQIVSAAGDGKIRDESECSSELRAFLREAPSDYIYQYVQSCLNSPFVDSGLILQDLVNEIGHRLEFEVEHGLYRGRKNATGHDGIWRSNSTRDILLEVKTTDYITIPLEKIAAYKKQLVEQHKISADAAILIVVGREDTGALEAQIRGSRYAWDMRLISADRLSTLLQIKEQSNEDSTVRQIKELLQLFEYTKIDKIIDVIFATAEDVETQEDKDEPAEQGQRAQTHTNRDLLNAKRQAAVEALGRKLGVPLTRLRQTLFWNSDKTVRVCAAVSKRYERTYQPYWYAFHPAWNEFLKEGQNSFFLLACMDREKAYAIPHAVMKDNLINLNTTERSDGKSYWHVILGLDDHDELVWNMTRAGKKLSLAQYQVSITGP